MARSFLRFSHQNKSWSLKFEHQEFWISFQNSQNWIFEDPTEVPNIGCPKKSNDFDILLFFFPFYLHVLKKEKSKANKFW